MSQYSVGALQLLDDLKVDELMDLRKSEFKYRDTTQLNDDALALQLEKDKLKEIRGYFWDQSKEDDSLLKELKNLSHHPSLKDKERLIKIIPFRSDIPWLRIDNESETFIDYLKDILVGNSQTRSQKKKAFYDQFRKNDLVIARKIVRKIKKKNRALFDIELSWFEQILNPRVFSDPKTSEIKENSSIPWWAYAITFWFIIKVISMVGK